MKTQRSSTQQLVLSKQKFYNPDRLCIHLINTTSYQKYPAPNSQFWKFCTRKLKGPKVLIPDTIIYNDMEMNPYWLYSDSNGYIKKTQEFGQKQIINKLGLYASPDQLVGVLKRSLDNGNELRLISCKNLFSVINNLNNSKALSTPQVLQRFIKCRGPKPFIYRTIVTDIGKNDCYILTSNNKYFSKSKQIDRYVLSVNNTSSYTVVSAYCSKINNTVQQLNNLKEFVEKKLGKIEKIVGDFVKDEAGIIWLIDVKYFKLKQPHKKISIQNAQKSLPNYQKTSFLQKYLRNKMTTKMIIQTDKHLKHRGKTFDWITRSDINDLQKQNLYQQHIVCYKWYLIPHQLLVVQLELQFAQCLAIQGTQQTKAQITTLGDSCHTKATRQVSLKKLFKSSLPQTLQINKSEELKIIKNVPVKKSKFVTKLQRFRFFVVLKNIKELVNVDSKYYIIEYVFMQQKIRMRFEVINNFALINRMKLFYIFAQGRKYLNQFIGEKQTLKLILYSEKQAKKEYYGQMELPLSDFQSDKVFIKEFYKMFSLKSTAWGWGLDVLFFYQCALGLVSSGFVDCSNVLLKQQDHVYVPPMDFYTCEPLPEQWQKVLLEIGRQQKKQMTSTMQSNILFQREQKYILKGSSSNTSNLQFIREKEQFQQENLSKMLQKEIVQYEKIGGRRKRESKKKIYY